MAVCADSGLITENIANGAHIANLASVRTRNQSVVDTLGTLLRRGAEAGVFRRDVDAVNLHMSISALCFYNVSNRHTFSQSCTRQSRIVGSVCGLVEHSTAPVASLAR